MGETWLDVAVTSIKAYRRDGIEMGEAGMVVYVSEVILVKNIRS